MAVVGDRPYPPGDYGVVVVGSGPGALQTSYSLRALGVPHAVLSADVVARTLLRCVVVSGPDLEQFLLDRPQLMLRLLKAEAQRLRNALEWRS